MSKKHKENAISDKFRNNFITNFFTLFLIVVFNYGTDVS